MIFANSHGKSPHTLDEVSPLDGTALVRQFKFPATWRLETSRLGPVMQTKSEGRRGSQMCRLQCTHHWDKEFPEPRRGESEYGR